MERNRNPSNSPTVLFSSAHTINMVILGSKTRSEDYVHSNTQLFNYWDSSQSKVIYSVLELMMGCTYSAICNDDKGRCKCSMIYWKRGSREVIWVRHIKTLSNFKITPIIQNRYLSYTVLLIKWLHRLTFFETNIIYILGLTYF